MALKLCTLNVNGFRQGYKQRAILEYMKLFNIDIVFLQETHVTCLREAHSYTKHWSGRNWWSFGENRSRGVGILIAKDLDYTFVRSQHDWEGRLISVDLNMGTSQYRLINVYAPNNPGERKIFIDNLQNYLVASRQIILGGDFNFVENGVLDRWGGRENAGTVGATQMENLRKDFFLIDCFRARMPNRKEYTWRSGTVHARLDRFYVSDNMRPWIESVIHKYCTCSDHFYTHLNFKAFDADEFSYGPGYWKCNDSTLDNLAFVHDFENLWTRNLSVRPVKDGIWWENCKVEFKKLIIEHSRRISKSKKRQIVEREEMLKALMEFIRSASCPAEINEYEECITELRSEINDLLVDNLKGNIIRSRAQCLEEGERPTRFFLSLERMHARAKLITQVQGEGGV